MTSTNRSNHTAGFTLTELMIVIVIVVVLTSIAFVGVRRAMVSAKIASNMNNLRNLGTALTSITSDQGEYPPGRSINQERSWAALVVDELHGPDALQSDSLISPLVTSDVPPDYRSHTITNYSVSPFIFSPENEDGRAWKVTPSRLLRPSEQILLGDGLPSSEDAPYGLSATVLQDLIDSGRSGNTGIPPVSDPELANQQIEWPANIKELTSDSNKGFPAFRNLGKCHFLFADCHVEAMGPKDLKFKHFAISY